MPDYRIKTIRNSEGHTENQVLEHGELMGWIFKSSKGWHFSDRPEGFETRKDALEALIAFHERAHAGPMED